MVPTTANEGYARLIREEWEDALAALAELERDCATAKAEGIQASFDYLLTYAANNYHPNHQETCDKENAIIERAAEAMLDCLSPEWSAKWKEVSQLCVRIAELERENREMREKLAELEQAPTEIKRLRNKINSMLEILSEELPKATRRRVGARFNAELDNKP